MFLHLPSGAAGIHGFVKGGGDIPETGGNLRRERSIRDGGSISLFEGLDPMRHSITAGPIFDLRTEPPGFDRYGFDWAQRSTSDVHGAAAQQGWEVISRREAAEILIRSGYVVPPRRETDGTPHFHSVLWLDQVDDLTWYVRESFDGKRFTFERTAFVRREIVP